MCSTKIIVEYVLFVAKNLFVKESLSNIYMLEIMLLVLLDCLSRLSLII